MRKTHSGLIANEGVNSHYFDFKTNLRENTTFLEKFKKARSFNKISDSKMENIFNRKKRKFLNNLKQHKVLKLGFLRRLRFTKFSIKPIHKAHRKLKAFSKRKRDLSRKVNRWAKMLKRFLNVGKAGDLVKSDIFRYKKQYLSLYHYRPKLAFKTRLI